MEMSSRELNTEWKTLNQQLLTVAEVARYLRVSRATVWRWCQEGSLPAFRVGRVWRIRKQDLLELPIRNGMSH